MQEFCQAQKNKVAYRLKEIKKIGDKQIFLMEVQDELGTFQAVGQGQNKKEAEQQAAQKVIKKLGLETKKE